jgi:hypothetical protein
VSGSAMSLIVSIFANFYISLILIISFIINYKHLIMFMILGDNVLNEKHIPSSPQELKDTLFSILVLFAWISLISTRHTPSVRYIRASAQHGVHDRAYSRSVWHSTHSALLISCRKTLSLAKLCTMIHWQESSLRILHAEPISALGQCLCFDLIL